MNPILWPNIENTSLGGTIKDQTGTPKAYLEPNLSIRFCFKNYGKTPAEVKLVRAVLIESPNPPNEEIAFTSAMKGNRIIVTDASTPELWTPPIDLSEAIRRALLEQRTFLWFYGTVSFDDFFGAEYVTEFCWAYDARMAVLAPYNEDRKRNKCTRQVPSDPSAGLS